MRNPDFNLPVHDGSLFSWKDDLGVVEVSDLNKRPFDNVWNDSCDLGFKVRSHKTGVEKLFLLTHTKLDREGCIERWTFESADDKVGVFIFND